MYTKLIVVIASIFTAAQGQFQLSLELAELAREIPGGGIPGMDYPILGAIPDTGFICRGVGYFPDVQVNCQVFHICSYSKPTMMKDSYLCPNGTTFNVFKRGCDWWFNSDCVQYDVKQLAREISPSEVTKSFHTGTVAIPNDVQNSSVFTIIPTSTQSTSLQTTMWNVDNAGTSIFTIMPTKTTHTSPMVISSQTPLNISKDQLKTIEYTRTPDILENTNIINNIRDIVAGLIPEVTTSSFFNLSLPVWPVGFNFSFPIVTTESIFTDTKFDVTPTPDILAPEFTTTFGDRDILTSDMENEDNTIFVKLPGGNKVKVTATLDGPVPNIEIDTELTPHGDVSHTSEQETNKLSGNRQNSDGNLKPVISTQFSPTEYPYFNSDSQDSEDTTIIGHLNKNKFNTNNDNNNNNTNDFDLVTEYPDESTTWHYSIEHGIVNSPSAFPSSSGKTNVKNDVIQPEVMPFAGDNNDKAGTNINSITAINDNEHSTDSPFRLYDLDYDSFSNMDTHTENVIHVHNNDPSVPVLSEHDDFDYETTYSPLPSDHKSETKPSMLSDNSFSTEHSKIKQSNSKPIQPSISETATNSVYRMVDELEDESFPQDTFAATTEVDFVVTENSNVKHKGENQPSVDLSIDSDGGNNKEDIHPSADEEIKFDFNTEVPSIVTKAITTPSPPPPPTASSSSSSSSTTITTPTITTATSTAKPVPSTRAPSTRVKVPITRRTTIRPRITVGTRRTTTNQPPTTSNLNPLFFNNEVDTANNPLLRTDLEPFVPSAMPVNRCSQVKITRDGELPADVAALARNIPGGGLPGVDYPILSGVIRSNFHCEDFTAYGYYADPQACCQMYHVCQPRGVGWQRDSFICPNGTIFNQKVNVCDWWYNTDCSQSETFYPAKRKARTLF